MNIATEINQIKQSHLEPNKQVDAVIEIFKKVLPDTTIEEKKDVLSKIYDTLIVVPFSKLFISRSIDLLKNNSEYLDWFLPRVESSPESILSLVNKLQTPSLVKKIIEEKLENLSQEDFKQQLIKPQYIDCHNDTNNLLIVYFHYLDKYKVDILFDISEYEPKKQEKIIKRFIKNKYFNSKESYEKLDAYVDKFSLKIQDEIYGYIFKFEKNMDLFRQFEPKYLDLLNRDYFDVNHIKLAVVDREKRAYIIDNYLQFPKVDSDEHFNRAIDCSLVREGQTNRNNIEFGNFVNKLLNKHLSQQCILNVDQFCIIVKRCYDFGFFDELTHLFSELKDKDESMYTKLNRKIQSFPIIEINRFTKLDFSLPGIKGYLNKLYFSYLNDTLEEKAYKTKSVKI